MVLPPQPLSTADGSSLRGRLREIGADLAPRHLPRTLIAALVVGGVAIAIAVSLAALVFNGDLAPALPMGIGLALFAAVATGVVTAFGSRFSFVVAGPQDNPAAIAAVAAAAIATTVPPETAVPTVVAMIAVMTLTLGVTLLLIGSLRIGGLVRYVPFPVVGGFLAATGVLLVQGGFGLLIDRPAGVGLMEADAALVWIPGLVIGAGGYLVARLGARRPMVTAIFLLSSAVTVRVAMRLGGVGSADASARGWLLGPFPDGISWQADTLRVFADADWGAIGSQWASIASVTVVAVVALLLYVHALEHVAGEDADVDRELRVAGVAAIATGAGGGFPGYLQFSDTMLMRSITVRRGAVVATMMVVAAALLFGLPVLDLLPKAVIGGVIVMIGLSFLVEWLWDARRRLGRVDHALVAVIAGSVVVAGFLPAIALGIAIAVGLFVVRYSRTDVVRRVYPVSATASTLDRSPEQRAALVDNGESARIIEVRGFVFFGTATALFAERWLAPGTSGQAVQFVVFDMSGITGIDSSAVMAFHRLDRAAARHDATLVFAGLPEAFVPSLEAAFESTLAEVLQFHTLDTAVEWVEDRILDDVLGGHDPVGEVSFADYLASVLGGGGPVAAVVAHTRTVDLAVGERVITAGDSAPGLFFLERGRLKVVLERPGGSPVTLRTLVPGAMIGEISFYRGGAASATVLADLPSRLVHLPAAAMSDLERTDPGVAATIHRFCAVVLAERVLHAERAMRSGT